MGHQSSSGLGLSLIIAMLITDLDLSSQRALLAELGFGALIHSLGSDRQKCKPNWAITLAVGHQSSSGLGLSFIMVMLITDRDLSSLRAVFAELGFGTVSLFKRTEDLVVFWSSLWKVNQCRLDSVMPQLS